MNLDHIRDLFDIQQRRDIHYPDSIREANEHVVRHISRFDNHSTVIYTTGLTSNNADMVIENEIFYFEKIGHSFEWKLYEHDSPADLRDRLEARGFEIEEAEALLVLDLESAPEVLFQPVTHTIRRITEPDRLRDLLSVLETVWEENLEGIATMLAEDLEIAPDWISIYLAYVDKTPVSAAWVRFFEHNDFASLWGGATLVEHRGKGLYTALLAVRAQEARKRGVRYLTVDASSMSRPILEKHGFQLISWTYPCQWHLKGLA